MVAGFMGVLGSYGCGLDLRVPASRIRGVRWDLRSHTLAITVVEPEVTAARLEITVAEAPHPRTPSKNNEKHIAKPTAR